MRRSDVINIILGLFYLATLLWGVAFVKFKVDDNTTFCKTNKELPSRVEMNTEFRQDNAGLSACVDQNSHWIEHNKSLPDKVLTSEIKVEFLQRSIDKLTTQIEISNRNFAQLNHSISNRCTVE